MPDLTTHPALLVLFIAVVATLLGEIPIGIRVPTGVLQVALGILVGPHVLGFAKAEGLLASLGFFGTCALFFMAGMELDLGAVKGRPLSLALRGWLISLALGFVIASLLHVLPFVRSPIMVAIALTTTSLGILMSILRDGGELGTPFGRLVLAAGAAGEFCPVVVMSLVFARDYTTWQEAGLLLVFVALAVFCALVALGLRPPRVIAYLSRSMNKTAQLPVLLAMLLLAGFGSLAQVFGLEAIMGGFAAGMVVGLATRGEDGEPMRAKIAAITYGFFVPFFYVVSGMKFDLTALLGSTKALSLLPLFVVLLLLVRGTPVFLYRAELAPGERVPFVLYTSLGLSILIAVTNIGVETGRMLPEIAAALVGAGMVSVLVFPALAMWLRSRAASS